MINLKPTVYSALTSALPTVNISDQYPKEWKTFPKITYSEESNTSSAYYDGEDQFSRHTYRIDIYDKRSTSSLFEQIDAVMVGLGFQRIAAMDDVLPADYKHKVLRYAVEVDEKTMTAYHY